MILIERYKLNKQNKNKEKNSFSEYLIQIKTKAQLIIGIPLTKIQRSLLCTSIKIKSYKASVTVEISMVVPLFLMGFLCMILLLEMMAIQLAVRSGMQDVARTYSSSQLSSSYITNEQLESTLVSMLGNEAMDNSIIVGGSDGLDLSKTEIDQINGAVKLVASYKVALPFPRFFDLGMSYEETLIFKRWTGYKSGTYFANGQIVYITEHQSVYHTDPSCTHLQLQITMVAASSVSGLLNNSNGTYSSCGICKPGDLEDWDYVYVTASGSGYHGSLECSSLKRTVVSVNREDVIGKGVCQRCSGD